MSRCDETRMLLGSHALGGLEPAEATAVREHLRGCAACRREHERLSGLPRLLDLVEPGPRLTAPPPLRLEGAVLAGYAAAARTQVGARPANTARRWPAGLRRWRVALPSAAAGAALAVAVLALAGVLSAGGAQTRVVLTAPAGEPAAHVEARLERTGAGTQVELDGQLAALRPGELYELWFVRAGGRVSAGTFTVGPSGRARVRLTTAATAGRYDRIGITREPDGLDPARNGTSVAVGVLSS